MRRLFALVAVVLVAVTPTTGSRLWVGVAHADTPPAKTHVCGQITTDTTWTVTGSPYQLDCNVSVSNLTITPGVVVLAPIQISLKVRKLTASGSKAAPILFTCPPSNCGDRWGGISAGPGSTLSYVVVEHAQVGISGFPSTVQNSIFRNNGDGIDYYPTYGGEASLSGSEFDNNGKAVDIEGESPSSNPSAITVSHCTFFANQYAVLARTNANIRVEYSGIGYGGTAISVLQGGYQGGFNVSVDNSLLTTNGTGISIGWLTQAASAPGGVLSGHGNNFVANQEAAQVIQGIRVDHIDLTSNYWGTTDAAVIQKSLLDCHADASRPCIAFQPFASAPNAAAPASPVRAVSFSVSSVQIRYPGANQKKSLKVHMRALLHASVTVTGGGPAVTVRLGFRVTRQGRTVFFHSGTPQEPYPTNGVPVPVDEPFTPTASGAYVFTFTAFVVGKHKHRSVSFSVTAH